MSAAAFALLLTLYRRDDGMREMFVASLLVALLSLVMPDGLCLLPILWWAAGVQKALNMRVWLASVIGVITVVIYAALVYFFFRDSNTVSYVQTAFEGCFNRDWCLDVMPLWVMIVSLVMCLLGLWSIIGHLLRYTTANVRVQIKILIVLPVWIICITSCLFPPVSTICLVGLLWLVSLYPAVLYVTTYGLPRLPSFSSNNPYRRTFSRRSRRK